MRSRTPGSGPGSLGSNADLPATSSRSPGVRGVVAPFVKNAAVFGIALAGLGLAQAAYTAEVIRAGILSVPRGQTRAAMALGMRPTTIFIRIVFPQAMRVIIPPVGNEVISMVKNTSLVSVIALAELLYTAQLIYARTYETIRCSSSRRSGISSLCRSSR
jgi:ABC-type amino acid transport system permease subunit